MARINIEEEAYSRVGKLADIMDVSIREALGTVSFLWHDSQEIVKTSGTLEDIKDWCRLYKISDQEVEKWISALEKSRFISREENGEFRIHGNDIQIESRISKLNRAAKGGKALKKKWIETKKKKAGLKQASSKLEEGLKQAPSPSMQCNSMQGNSVQSNAIQINANTNFSENEISGTVVPISKNANLNSEIWEAYRGAYFLSYQVEPVRNAKVNGQIAQLAKRLGAEAVPIVKFYLSHKKTFYVNKMHELGLCLSDAESLRTQWLRGKAITEHDLKRFSNAQKDAELDLAIAEGRI